MRSAFYGKHSAGKGARWVCLVLMLTLAGCEYLGPFGKKPVVPELLKLQDVKKTPAEPEVVEVQNQGVTETEYYPASGHLYGNPDVSAAGSHGKHSKKRQTPESNPAREGKYTLNFDDADISEVAKVILGDTLKQNYVINPKVTGKISLQTTDPLSDDEMIPTLETLLRMNGAALIKNGSIYHIEPDSAAIANAPNGGVGLSGKIQAGFQVRIVPLHFVGAKDMQKIVEPLLPAKSVVYADATRNLLMLAGDAEDLTSIQETIRVFDVDFMRGMSVAIFPLQNVDPSTLANELDALMMAGDKGAMSGMVRILPVERLNSVMAISAQPAYLRDVETWIERLDRFSSHKASNMHVYNVQNVDAMQLAHTLTQIFGQVNNKSGPGASIAPGMNGSTLGGATGGGAFGGTSGLGSSINGDTPSGQAPGSSSMGGFQSSGTGSSLGGSSAAGSSSGAFGSASGSAAGGTTGSSSGLGSSSSGTGSSGGFGSSVSGGAGGSAANRQSVAAELGNNARVIADPANNALVIFARPADYRDIELVLKELDVMPKQVLVDAMIAEVQLDGSLQYGLKWYFQHGSSTGATNLTTAAANAITTLATSAAANGGFTYVMAAKAITAQLDLLAQEKKLNILSTPSLMVLNNQEAQINVGDKIPTQTGSVTSSVGAAVTTTIQYQETGVTLKLRPRVNAGGLVLMTVQQEILAATNADPLSSTVNLTPTISQRKLSSTVAVHDGDTLALGGLIQEQSQNVVTGIPILSQLPYVGWLFGSTSKVISRKELVMLLTPRTVESRPDVTKVANEFRRRLTGWNDTMPLTPDAANPNLR